MDIKGIKMNGEILKEFSAGGGGVYRHILRGTSSIPTVIIVYNDIETPYSQGTKFYTILEQDVPYLCYSHNHARFGVARKDADNIIYFYGFNSTSAGDKTTINTSDGLESDTVTQVPFPWM